MSKSPGHLQWPDHQVKETHVASSVAVEVDDEVIAESTDAIRVDEDGHPPRYYLPRVDVRKEKLERSGTTTECPFKGTASYYSVRAGSKKLSDAVWSYESPYDEHLGLKDRMAFYDDKYPDIRVKLRP